jgi:epoxyqueuosine reductase QueG
MENEHDERIRRFSLELGFSLVGTADITSIRGDFLLPAGLLSRFPRALALAKRLSDDVLDEIEDRPTPLYFHHYRQTNYFLDRGTTQIADFIQDQGFHALAVPASQLIDWANQRAHVSHKAVARLAGLGWIGRNNLLVTPSWGARIRLATVLTDLPLPPGKPLDFGCGSCRRCLAPCPAGAIHEDPGAFDHRRCYEKLDEFRRQHIVSQHICGVCVKACRGPAGI